MAASQRLEHYSGSTPKRGLCWHLGWVSVHRPYVSIRQVVVESCSTGDRTIFGNFLILGLTSYLFTRVAGFKGPDTLLCRRMWMEGMVASGMLAAGSASLVVGPATFYLNLIRMTPPIWTD